MKEPFFVEVMATSAEQAFGLAKVPGKLFFRAVEAEGGWVYVSDVHRKLARCRENPDLYSDKAGALIAMLERWETSGRGPRDLAQLMIDNGDPWTEHPDRCRIIKSSAKQFLVFGHKYT